MKKEHHNYPALIWITGLPGAGKTTLAKEVFEKIRHARPSIYMDGDVFREIMGNDLGYSVEDRKKNAWRLTKMNHYLVQHGLTVVCATVSLYKEIHDWNRKAFDHYIEVFIDVPKKTLSQRDQKNLYSKAQQGKIDNVIGHHQSFDIPDAPHVTIKNDTDLNSFLAHADSILKLLQS